MNGFSSCLESKLPYAHLKYRVSSSALRMTRLARTCPSGSPLFPKIFESVYVGSELSVNSL